MICTGRSKLLNTLCCRLVYTSLLYYLNHIYGIHTIRDMIKEQRLSVQRCYLLANRPGVFNLGVATPKGVAKDF